MSAPTPIVSDKAERLISKLVSAYAEDRADRDYRHDRIESYIQRLEAVADAARNRSRAWTRETFIALDDALRALDADGGTDRKSTDAGEGR